MGHDSARAALICLHTSAERHRAIADQVGKNAKAALGKHKRSGARMARKPSLRILKRAAIRDLDMEAAE